MQALFPIFLRPSLVSISNVKPLTPVEFIQQILVPEAGLRLIQQDRDGKIDLEEAKRIMKESEEYGSIVYHKAKKDKNMPDEKKTAEPQQQQQQQEEHTEEQQSNEYIAFPMFSQTEEGGEDDDDDQPDDILSSQLSMVSQSDEDDGFVSSQTSEPQD